MNKTVLNRIIIFFIIGFGFISSSIIILLFKKFGYISIGTAKSCFQNIEGIFFPLIAIIAGFYFSNKYRKAINKCTIHTKEHFFVTLLIIVPISITPSILLVILDTVDSAFRVIDTYKMYGQAFCSAAITYYFADIASAEPQIDT